MNAWIPVAWALLALLHLPPAAVLLRPRWVQSLYGVSVTGDVGVLLVHRAVLFAAVALMCGVAAVDPGARPVSSVAAAVSMGGFLAIYLMSGAPQGPLRRIAWADAAGLLPLGLVLVQAWIR